MKKSIWALAMVVVVLALARCSPAPAEVLPTEPPTPAPTVPPTPVPTAEPSCPEPAEGTQLLRHDEHGYCLLYPEGLVRVGTPPDQVCLIPEGPSMGCHNAVAFFVVTDAGGLSASELADEKMAREGGFGPERESLTVAGLEAIVLPLVGGQASTRQVWFVYDDRLYTLSFVLPEPEDTAGVEQYERLYDTVVTSFTLLPVGLPPSPAAPSPEAGGSAVVVFVKDGNILVWEEATGQSQTIYDSGDVIRVELSDDAEVIAFLRRSVVQLDGDPSISYIEQSALWAVDWNGEHPRELVSAEALRARLNPSETDSTNIAQMDWIPGTHRLLFSGWKYIVQGEGESHAVPEGLNLVDADARTEIIQLPAGNALRFVPSPDGRQIALMSPTGLSFINIDGSNHRLDVLTYPESGITAPLFPTGVWTQDARAFLITGSFERSPTYNFDFTIWRVPVDSSSPEPLAAVPLSHPGSVTFSPDGTQVAYLTVTEEQPSLISGWSISPLTPGSGPLAIPKIIEVGYASLHWSPAGEPFMGNLRELCPDATQSSEECDSRIYFWGTVAMIHWIDSTRFLFLTRDPSVLFLARLDPAKRNVGITVPIVAWPVEAWVNPSGISAALAAPDS